MHDPLGILNNSTQELPVKKKNQADPLGILQTEPKKKEISSAAFSQELDKWKNYGVGGTVGSSVLPSEEKPKIVIDEDDPVKSILSKPREDYNKKNEEYNLLRGNELFKSGESTRQINSGNKLYYEQQAQQLDKAKKEASEAGNKYFTPAFYLEENTFQNGLQAKQYLQARVAKNGKLNPDNETEKLAQRKVEQYEKVANSVIEKGLPNAAIDEAMNDPASGEHLTKQYKELVGMGQDLPPAMKGLLVANYLSKHNKDLQAFADEHPAFAGEYENMRDNLLTIYPEFGRTVVANKVSRERQARGLNNKFANFNTDKFNDNTDKIANEILTPQELAIYNQEIKDHKKKYIDTGGFLNKFEEAIETGWHGTTGSIKQLLGGSTRADDLYSTLNREATNVDAGAKGIAGIMNEAGGFLGTVAYIGAGGNVLRMGGLNPAMANRTMMGLTFMDDFMKQAAAKYPDEPGKAMLSGVANTLGLMAASNIFPAKKLNQVFSSVKPEIETAIKELSVGVTDKQIVKDALANAFRKGVEPYLKGIGEMAALTQFNQTLDKALGLDQSAYNHYHPESEMTDVVKSMAIGGLLPNALIGVGSYRGKSAMKNFIYESASNPMRMNSAIDMQNIPDEVKQKLKANIDFLSKSKADLEARDIPEDKQKEYLFRSLQEKNINDKIENTVEPSIKKDLQNQVKKNAEIKETILKGGDEQKVIQRQSSDLVKEFYDEDLLKRAHKEMLETTAEEGKEPKLDEKKILPFLKYVAQQVNNITEDGKFNTESDARKSAQKSFPEQIIEAANEAFPDYKKIAEDVDIGGFKEQNKNEKENKNIKLHQYDVIDKNGIKTISFRIKEGNQKLGEIWAYESPRYKQKGLGYLIENVFLGEEYKGKGYGKEVYRNLNKLSIEKTGHPAWSTRGTRNENSERVWKSLVKSGEAEVTPEGDYRFIDHNTDRSKKPNAGFKGYIEPIHESESQTGMGQDIRMRNESTGFIGEIIRDKSSSYGSAQQIADKIGSKVQWDKENGHLSVSNDNTKTAMLARNIEFKGLDLTMATKKKIKELSEKGVEFIVGDQPDVDTQFIKYLQEIGAGFSIYHTEGNPRPIPRPEVNIHPINYTDDALQKSSPSGVLQHPQEGVGETGSERGGMEQGEQGNVTPETPISNEVKPEEKNIDTGKEEGIGIAHAATEEVRKKFNLSEYERNNATDAELEKVADEAIAKGYNPEQLISQMEAGTPPTGVENFILKKYLSTLVAKVEADPSDANIGEVERVVKASDKIGSLQSEAFRTRKGLVPVEDSLAAFFIRDKEVNQDRPLTEQQKATVVKEYENITNAEKAYHDKLAALEAENARLRAENEIKKAKGAKREKKDYAAERTKIFEDIRAKLKKARGEINVTPIPYAKELIAIAPEIGKLVKNVVEQGITKLDDVIKEVHGILKPEIPEITENDVWDLIAGKYDAKKEPIKLDAEAIRLKDNMIKFKQEREARLLREQYAQRTARQKAVDYTMEVLNVPRTIMSSTDFSAPLRQGIVASVAHPRTALKAFGTMFQQAFSQKKFDRWFYDLKEDPRYKVMTDSGLAISDPHDYRLSAKEEAFMNNLAEKIPFVGKIIKGSERAYVGYLNKMRVDLFNRFAERFLEEGKTFENNPELYKKTAEYINNQTGRGKLPSFGDKLDLEKAAPFLNTIFFSPRLIASRLNLLNPYYYYKLPKELRVMAAKDMFKFVALGMSVLALAKLNGAEVEDDPRSSDFGKIRSGNTRWDIWGGFQQYVRLFSQIASGEKKSSGSGEITKLNGEGRFGETRADVTGRFGRGKLAPVPSMVMDFLSTRTASGDPVTVQGEAESHLLPLIYSDIKDAYKDQGIKSLFTVGVPASFGVGVQTFLPRQSTSSKPKKPKKQTKHKKTE